jgi:hypothetical protein
MGNFEAAVGRLRSAGEIRAADVERGKLFEHDPVALIEPIVRRAIKVDDLRIRRRVARDVASEYVHVGYDDRPLLRPGRAAHARIKSDARNGRLTLEWSEHELLTTHEVETRPIDVGQRSVKKRGKVRCVRNWIAFDFDEGRCLHVDD